MTKRSPENAATLIRMWNEGADLLEIGEALNMVSSSVYAYRITLGLPDREGREGRGKGWSAGEIADVQERYARGESAGEIAKVHPGRTRNSIIGILFRTGKMRDPARKVRHDTSVKKPRPKLLSRPAVPFKGIQPTGAEAERLAEERAAKGRAALIRAGQITVESPNARPFLQAPRFDACKWPIGEGLTMLACCNPVERGSYCSGHAAIAFTSASPRLAPRQQAKTASALTRYDRVAPTPRAANEDPGVWDAVA